MLEKEVWAKFKPVWPYHCERQEPGMGSGQPDVLLQDKHGMPGFAELKRPENVELRPSQWIWHERWQKGGGHIPVVTCFYKGSKLFWRVHRVMFKPVKHLELVVSRRSNIDVRSMTAEEMIKTVAELQELRV
jgi:hypothetical protein